MSQSDKKAILLGLDGATFDVLLPRAARGQMPNLRELLQEGSWGELRSTIPPFSAQAWVSLNTGKNQARHGVLDFWEPSADHVRRNFVSAQLICGETLWQIAGRHGLRVGVVNVPVTYPPEPVNGYLVTGFLTPPGKEDYVYPEALKDEVTRLVADYVPDPFDPLGPGKRQLQELASWMEKHERVARHLAECHPTEFFFSVAQALDHLQHLFWNEVSNPSGEGQYTSLVDRCFRLADEMVGHRRDMLDGKTHLFLVSDHGFGPVGQWFHVNRFLQEQGYLTLDEVQGSGLAATATRLGLTPQRLRSLVRSLDVFGLRRWMGRLARVTIGRQLERNLTPPIDWSRTQAVSGSPASEGIFINLEGREPQGVVAPGEPYEALCERLVEGLESLRDPANHEPVVQAVYRREELYEGPFLDQLPDIVFDLGDGPYLASDALGAGQVLEPLPPGTLQGRHRISGVFVAAGPGIRQGAQIEGARIVDVAPTVLYALGLPIPEDMDGRPLLEIFHEDYQEAHPVRYAPSQEREEAAGETPHDQEEKAEMERRLRGLGYVS
jgi:predicted AlkP superfamily phosphohydrolase/phosphomutase